MKKRRINLYKIFLALLLSAGMLGCGSDESVRADRLCDVSWKLYGFGTSDSDIIKIAEPSECAGCYVIKFNSDGTFHGQTTSNDFYGKYLVMNESFRIVESITTKVGEVGDGYKFYDAFLTAFQYDVTDEGYLKLYYNDNNDYLMFYPQ